MTSNWMDRQRNHSHLTEAAALVMVADEQKLVGFQGRNDSQPVYDYL